MFVDGGNGAGGTVTAQTLRVDGTVVQTLTPAFHKSNADPQSIGTLGTSSVPLIGKVAEIIQYSRHLAEKEIHMVEGYLANKYGITSATSWKSPNPYFTGSFTNNANITENTLSFLFRPIRVINKYQAVVYRRYVTQGPQASGITYGNYFSDTTGGKYGVFAYDMPNARASEGFYIRATNPDTNHPYAL